jgi:hypothetical protein
MNIKKTINTLIGLIMVISLNVNAGLIEVKGGYSATNPLTSFGFTFIIDSDYLQNPPYSYFLLNDKSNPIKDIEIQYIDSSLTSFKFDLIKLKEMDVQVVLDFSNLVIDGSEQINKINDVNFFTYNLFPKTFGLSQYLDAVPFNHIDAYDKEGKYDYSFHLNSFTASEYNVEVPEPSTFAIFTLGILGLVSRKIKRN